MPNDTQPGQPAAESPSVTRAALLATLTGQREQLVKAVMSALGLIRADAEDVVQDVTYQVLSRDYDIDLDDPTKLFSYLKRAVINRAHDGRRAAVREGDRIDPGVPWLTAADLPDPAVAVGRQMLLLDVFADLATLPEVERDVYLARYYDDIKPAQIATLLDLKPRQVETKLRQATQRIANLYARRRDTEAYFLLAALLRRTRRVTDGSGLAAAPAMHTVPVAAVTAFALVVTQGATGEASRPATTAAERHGVFAPTDDGMRRGSGPTAVRSVVGAERPTSLDPAHASGQSATACVSAPFARQRCVTLNREVSDLPGSAALNEDVVTVTVLDQPYSARESLTPICEYVPGNPVVQCSGQGSSDRLVGTSSRPSGRLSSWRFPTGTSSAAARRSR